MDQKALKTILDYSPETGEFIWKIQPRRRPLPRPTAGHAGGRGYLRIGIRGRYWYAHRLVFLWMTGEIPKEVDHINRNKGDNRWKNLRATDRKTNLANVAGRKGVRKRYGRWYARYGSFGHIGVYDTEEAAHRAYKKVVIAFCGFDPDAQ